MNVLRYNRTGKLDHYIVAHRDGFPLWTVGHDGAFNPEGWYGCIHDGRHPEREAAREPVVSAFQNAIGLFSPGAWILPVL